MQRESALLRGSSAAGLVLTACQREEILTLLDQELRSGSMSFLTDTSIVIKMTDVGSTETSES